MYLCWFFTQMHAAQHEIIKNMKKILLCFRRRKFIILIRQRQCGGGKQQQVISIILKCSKFLSSLFLRDMGNRAKCVLKYLMWFIRRFICVRKDFSFITRLRSFKAKRILNHDIEWTIYFIYSYEKLFDSFSNFFFRFQKD